MLEREGPMNRDSESARRDLAWLRGLVESHPADLPGWRYQLLWGGLTTMGLAATWAALLVESPGLIALTWAFVLAMGWGGTMLLGRTQSEHRIAEHASARGGQLWFAVGVAITLVATIGPTAGIVERHAIAPLAALLLGVGYFASGTAGPTRWLRHVGVAWWVVGVGLSFARGPHTLLMFAVAVVALEIGPALALRTAAGSVEAQGTPA